MMPGAFRTEIVTASVAGPRIVLNASGYIVARRVATVSSMVTGRVLNLLVHGARTDRPHEPFD